jgi:hypothetical protein
VEVVGRRGSEPDRCHESVPGRSGDSAAHRNPEPQDDVGECTAAGSIIPENWLLGQFNLTCRKSIVGAFFTLAPTQPPALQYSKVTVFYVRETLIRLVQTNSVNPTLAAGAPGEREIAGIIAHRSPHGS